MFTTEVFFVFVLQLSINATFLNARQTDKECFILNKEYSNGFLYIFRGFYTPLYYHAPKYFTDELPTTCDLSLSQCKKVACKCGNEKCCHTDLAEAAQWFLKHVPDKLNTYFIQSKFNRKYFYAKKNLLGNFISNLFNGRDTDFGSLNDLHDEAFMWELREQSNGWFEVWNVKYKERNLIKLFCFNLE